MTIFMIAQIIGYVGLLCSIIMLQFNKRDSILKIQVIAAALYSAHYLLIGAYTGFAANIIAGTRGFLFHKVLKKKKSSIIFPTIFIIAFIISGIITWQGPVSLLPIFATFFGTLAYWQKNPKYIRRLILLTPPFWIVYNIVCLSYPGLIAEIFIFTSNLIAIIRFDILKHKDIRKIHFVDKHSHI